MSRRNKRKWWEDGELGYIEKDDGTRPIVKIERMDGEDHFDHEIVLYWAREVGKDIWYTVSSKSLKGPTPQQLQEARQNGWQLPVAVG